MSLAIYTSAAWLANGGLQVADNATIEVRRESDGALASIFSDREGAVPITNPSAFGDAFGRFEFFVYGGAYRVRVTQDGQEYTLRYQAIGTAGELDQDDLISPEEVDQAIGVHAEEEGGIHGIPEGERALHTGTNGGGTPIGGYVTVQTDLTGAEEPDPDTHIKLEAGLTGTGEYNEGKLDNESVSGSAPLVVATAEIADAESPLFGQTVHLLETERRFLMPGTSPGAVAFDQMQQITGELRGGDSQDARQLGDMSGAFTAGGFTTRGIQAREIDSAPWIANFNSANSPDARTGDHTNVKHIEAAVYMRIK